jgi:alcohol dehydrogenase class IV
VGYVHAIAHQLGALYHLPHGLANAIVLPNVLDASRPDCDRRLAQLARQVHLPDPGQGDAALAAAFTARVRQLNATLSIPSSVQPLREADFGRIVDSAFAEAHGTYGVPHYLDRHAAQELLSGLLPEQNAAAPAKELRS